MIEANDPEEVAQENCYAWNSFNCCCCLRNVATAPTTTTTVVEQILIAFFHTMERWSGVEKLLVRSHPLPAVVNVFMSRDVFVNKQVVERRLKLLVKVDKLTISALELRARTCQKSEMKIIIQATLNNSTRKSWIQKNEILIIQSSRWRWRTLPHFNCGLESGVLREFGYCVKQIQVHSRLEFLTFYIAGFMLLHRTHLECENIQWIS